MPHRAISTSAVVGALACLTAALCPAFADEAHRFHAANVLGSSIDVSVYGGDAGEAQAAFDAALGFVAELEALLSPYRADSEINRVNRREHEGPVSEALAEVVKRCLGWQEKSLAQFSCRHGSVRRYWVETERQQLRPSRIEVRALARAAMSAELGLDEREQDDGQVEYRVSVAPEIQLDTAGIAKGYIIDEALKFLRTELTDATAIKVDIGGDAVYWGRPPGLAAWSVAVPNPIAALDNGQPIATLELSNKAVAVSGSANRAYRIGRRSYSHIYSTRDGWPLLDAPSAIVIAVTASDADAVATALGAQTPARGIRWVDSLPGIEAMLVGSDGTVVKSQGWQTATTAVPDTATAPVRLEYTIPRLSVARYERPYLAIWVSDERGLLVRNLLLLGESERWARENKAWWRRIGRRDPDLVHGYALPTRRPGTYRLEWDGTDSFGLPVSAGEYTLNIEASREHGGHDFRAVPIAVPFEPGALEFQPLGEIGAVSLSIAE